jgi:hypothetical protein
MAAAPFTFYPPPAVPAGRKSSEEIAKMSPAQRLDYAQQFDQSKMPEWRDPRAKP